MKRIKLMHFIHGLNTGGAETLVKNYLLNFDKKKFDITLLCLTREEKSTYNELINNSGIKVVYVEDFIPFKGQTNKVERAINRCCRFIITKRIIRRESPDIVHAHLLVNSYLKYARLKPGTVIFYTVHTEPSALWDKRKRRQKDLAALKWLTLHYKVKFVVLHLEMKSTIEKWFGISDVVVLNNGVDVQNIQNAHDRLKIRNELDISDNDLVIGHIGRFAKVKNHDFLVDTFIELKHLKKNVYLLMVGDGIDKKRIEERLNKHSLQGRYSILSNRRDIPNILNAMDFFVFPSLYEGLPLSLIEAQIAKKPCLISDTINRSAVISNLVTILQLDAGADAWAKAIYEYKSPEKISLNTADWDIKVITKDLEKMYLDEIEDFRDE